MSKLAIDGGTRIFPENFGFEPWPPVRPETAERLKEVYMRHNWSFYGAEEKKWDRLWNEVKFLAHKEEK